MNRLISTLILLMSVTSAIAGQVSASDAMAQAIRFLTDGQTSPHSPSAAAGISLSYTGGDIEEPAFYVFQCDNGHGFVIISGEDCMPQTVGYSYTSPFDRSVIPDGLKAYLSDYTAVIRSVRDGASIARADIPAGTAIGPLMTVQWDQDAPYNNKCPFVKSSRQRSATGCVATAMAQIMKHHRHPASGYGTVVWNKQEFDLSKSVYDWSQMPDRYIRGRYTTAQADQVAQLMVDCGHSVQMDYGTESGTYTEYVAPAFVRNFGYDGGIQYQMRSGWSDRGWIALIRSNLEQGLPVIYGGDGTSGGHQFICDGIDTDNLLHINWGWGGMSDGFYDMDILSPDDTGIGGSAITFNEYQDIICWIRPASSLSNSPADWEPNLALGSMDITTPVDADGRYRTASSADPVIDAELEIDNATGERVSFLYGYVIYDEQGAEVRRSISRSGSLLDAGYYIPDADAAVSVKGLPSGKYHVSWRWQNRKAGIASEPRAFWAGDIAEGFWIEIRPDGYYRAEADPAGMDATYISREWQLTQCGRNVVITGAPEGAAIRVYSSNGSTVISTTAIPEATDIDMTGTAPGLYIVSVTAPDGTTRKFKTALH